MKIFAAASVMAILVVVVFLLARSPSGLAPATGSATQPSPTEAPTANNIQRIKITDLTANSGLQYEVVESLQVGEREYTDRDYVFKSIPDRLTGLVWIRTANNDKLNEKAEVSFKIDREAYVYIMWIARDEAEHKWLRDNYGKIEGQVDSTDEPLSIFKSKKPFPKGLVTTYQAATENGMYVIALEPAGPATTRESSGK